MDEGSFLLFRRLRVLSCVEKMIRLENSPFCRPSWINWLRWWSTMEDKIIWWKAAGEESGFSQPNPLVNLNITKSETTMWLCLLIRTIQHSHNVVLCLSLFLPYPGMGRTLKWSNQASRRNYHSIGNVGCGGTSYITP